MHTETTEFSVKVSEKVAAFIEREMKDQDRTRDQIVASSMYVYQLWRLGYLGETEAYRELRRPVGCGAVDV